MRIIKGKIYKVNRLYRGSEFVEADNVDDIARYVAGIVKKGCPVTQVTEIRPDGTHPRVAILKSKAFKDAIKGV